jgi:hypothetical protein
MRLATPAVVIWNGGAVPDRVDQMMVAGVSAETRASQLNMLFAGGSCGGAPIRNPLRRRNIVRTSAVGAPVKLVWTREATCARLLPSALLSASGGLDMRTHRRVAPPRRRQSHSRNRVRVDDGEGRERGRPRSVRLPLRIAVSPSAAWPNSVPVCGGDRGIPRLTPADRVRRRAGAAASGDPYSPRALLDKHQESQGGARLAQKAGWSQPLAKTATGRAAVAGSPCTGVSIPASQLAESRGGWVVSRRSRGVRGGFAAHPVNPT